MIFRFTVDKETGNIRVNCTNCSAQLDREKQNIYYMTYTARDEDNRSDSVSLIIELIDVNDNEPVFLSTSYKAVVEENDETYVNESFIKLEVNTIFIYFK